MNILVVVPWDYALGGVVSVAGHMARYLAGQGHQIRFFTPGESNRLQRRTTTWDFQGYDLALRSVEGGGGSLVDVAKFTALLPSSLGQLIAMVRGERIDLINIHYPLAENVHFGLIRKVLGIPLVTVIHGADLFPGGAAETHYPWSLRFLLNASDRIVTPSESLRRDVAAVLPALAPRTLAIHNSVDISEFDWNLRAGDPGGRRTILCIAAHNEKKALDVLLKAFAELRRSEQGLRLQLVGDGPLRPDLEALAAQLELGDDVQFLGRQDREQIAKLLGACSAFVVPSRAEPFGIVVLEGMMAEKPVVASAVGGIVEIVEDGRNGLLVPPDDPAALAAGLRRVLTDPALAATLGKAGRETVLRRFSRDRMGGDYSRLFTQLVSDHAS